MRLARSRQETRAAVLNYIWRKKGSFRTDIADKTGLTEASVSRIVSELRAEGVLTEKRQPAEYPGGPSAILTLSKDRYLGALEVSSNRVHAGIATLDGDLVFSERFDLKDGASAGAVSQAIAAAVGALADSAERSRLQLDFVGVSVPGYDARRAINPIVMLDPSETLARLNASFLNVPVEIANSIVARAINQRLTLGTNASSDDYLYVFVGHGVAAAIVSEFWGNGDVTTCEIGHMVMDPKGPQCRCGHFGCLEAYLSTSAIAPRLKIDEVELLALGDAWPQRVPISEKTSTDVHSRLFRLGMAIGNALNMVGTQRVFLGGWPANLGDAGRASILAGIDCCLLGGAGSIELNFVQSELGQEPAAALSLATFGYLKRGAQPTQEENVLMHAPEAQA
ncbi:ROK family transcriptional regulator protein (plasmid) [Rhizobium sp. NXC24]|nr:ROK family transcriptional regulator protein [Rhizobium sp. NXC24]